MLNNWSNKTSKVTSVLAHAS